MSQGSITPVDTLTDNEVVLEKGSDNVPSNDPFTPPDGGLHAWLTLAGTWLVLFCSFGLLTAFGVFEDFYVREYLSERSPADISWIGSLQFALQFTLGLVAGSLFDAGYFHHIMIAGCSLFTFSLFMLSLSQPQQYYQIILSQGVGCGLSMGFMFLPAVGIISHWFKRRRALAIGIAFTGTSTGGIFFSLVINKLFVIVGFAWTVRAAAFIVLGLLTIANLLMKTRLPPKRQRPPTPPVSIKGILKDPLFTTACFSVFFIFLGLFFPFFYLQLFCIQKEIDHTLTFYTLAIMNGASVLGRLLPNFLADVVGIHNVMIPATTISAILIFSMLGINDSAGAIAFSILYGLSSGSVISLISPLIAETADHVWEIGMRTGVSFFIVSFSCLAGTPIDGALLTKDYNWYPPIIFSGIVVLIGNGLLVASARQMAKKKGTWKV